MEQSPEQGPLPLRLVCRRAAALLKDVPADAVEVVSYLEGGYSHANYRIRVDAQDFAVRLPSEAAGDWPFEADWWRRLPEGLGVERISLDTSTGALLTRWIEGPLLVHAEIRADELAAYLAHLHAALPDPRRRYPLTELVGRWLGSRKHPDGVAWAHGETQVHASRLQRLDVLAACHNDLNPWNVIVGEDRWYTLDWETVGANDPLFDAVALLCGLAWEPADIADFVKKHFPDMQSQQERLHGTLIGYRLREYAWADAQIVQGNVRPEIVAQREDSLAALRQLQKT